jgi:hypothetical protein
MTLADIQKTKTYQAMSLVKKRLCDNKSNRDYIIRGYEVANTIGYAKWIAMCGYSEQNKQIIKDLIKNNA